MQKSNILTTTHLVLISFLLIIFIGFLLLMLPISQAKGVTVTWLDALFTATTASCVTGLVTVPTFSTWSTFGHIIILILIQVGGLGVITTIFGITVFLNKKMGLQDGILLQDALNLNTMYDISNFLKKIIMGTFIVEGMGAICYMFVFIPQFGTKGIWISVFTAISAFCNAGIDIIGENSLCEYTTNPIINLTTILMIVLGGLGFIVWIDVIEVIKNKNKHIKNLTLHSKIVLIATAGLILFGMLSILVLEYHNPDTIGNMSFGNKLIASLFQSVTTRTAGFASIPQENFRDSTSILHLILMFIGGSPVGTAGGVKTVTFIMVFAFALSTVKNKKDVNMLNRRLPIEMINKSVAVICTSLSIVFISTILLSATTEANILDVVYETVSACATVGLTRNFTGTLNVIGKLIIIITMYLGRVGPISLAVAFNTNKSSNENVRNPVEGVSVG